MRLIVNNTTNALNDYYFQTLCLLYYPGAKFPPDDTTHPDYASFTLSEENGIFTAAVTFGTSYGEASATCTSDGSEFITAPSENDIAEAAVGGAVLQAGKELFSFVPPWGSLTGLRPVKRARYYLERGFTEAEVKRFFADAYNVSEEKSTLAVEIAERETELLSRRIKNECCLYIAIPFCPTHCEYCSFISYSGEKLFKLLPEYLLRLKRDIARTGAMIKKLGLTLTTVYVGGGTPTTLDERQLFELLEFVSEAVDLSAVTEYTVEAGRPDTITQGKLDVLKGAGVRRVSVNPQTTSDTVLKAMGRKHTVADFFFAADLALNTGFDSVNADIIAGLPGDTAESFAKTINEVTSLGFNNITVHTLSVKNAAPLRFSEKSVYDPEGTATRANIKYGDSVLRKNGYFPYYLYRQKNTVGNGENTGYSLAGKECIYNILMMEELATVFACGASAITKLVSADGSRIERIAFPKYPFEYLKTAEGIGEACICDFFERN